MYNGAGVQSTVAVLDLVMNQGPRQPLQGSPQHWPLVKNGRGQRSILVGGFCWRCGYRFCGGCEGAAGPGVQTPTPSRGRRKTITGQILGCSCCDGEDTSRSENKTRLVVTGPPGPGSLLRRRGLPGMASMPVHALRLLTVMFSSRCPTWRVKERGPQQRGCRSEGGEEGPHCRARPRLGGHWGDQPGACLAAGDSN